MGSAARFERETLRADLPQRAGEVVPKVFDVLATHAQTQEARRQVFLARQFAPALDGAFHAAQAGCGPDDPQGVTYGVGRGRGLELQSRSWRRTRSSGSSPVRGRDDRRGPGTAPG